jgi:hypothetical protein
MFISWIDSSSIDIMEVINSKDATASSKTIASTKMPADQGHVQEQRCKFLISSFSNEACDALYQRTRLTQVFQIIRQRFNTM